ncbi:hypothetical protein VP01_9917g1, partial [Puccinia sorghi]
QGRAWKELAWHQGAQHPNTIRLVLLLFINWFNPRGNILAGKKQSIGIITLNCMSLSPTMRNKSPWTFLAGITPGPQAPDITTITHLIKPIIDKLHELTNPLYLNTHAYPTGREIELRLLPLIGDLGATHKVAGFASHSENYFCSWCDAHRDNMAKLTLSKPRTGVEV